MHGTQHLPCYLQYCIALTYRGFCHRSEKKNGGGASWSSRTFYVAENTREARVSLELTFLSVILYLDIGPTIECGPWVQGNNELFHWEQNADARCSCDLAAIPFRLPMMAPIMAGTFIFSRSKAFLLSVRISINCLCKISSGSLVGGSLIHTYRQKEDSKIIQLSSYFLLYFLWQVGWCVFLDEMGRDVFLCLHSSGKRTNRTNNQLWRQLGYLLICGDRIAS